MKALNILILGGSGGIGGAIAHALNVENSDHNIIATYHSHKPKALSADDTASIDWHTLNANSEGDYKTLADYIQKHHGELDWVVNAIGFLHDDTAGPEKSIKHVQADFFIKNMTVNTLPTLLAAKHLGALLKHDRPAVFATVSAKVGSIEDNGLGGWYSYRCSKAALNMAIKNIAIEWQRSNKNVAVAALHPGTTNTELSKPFQKNVPLDKLFAPEHTADCLLRVIRNLASNETGQFCSWDGSKLPW